MSRFYFGNNLTVWLRRALSFANLPRSSQPTRADHLMDTPITQTPVIQQRGFSLAPQSIAEAIQFAEMLSKSDIVPKDFKGNSGNILVAIQWGMELGLQPMQAMQNIAVINGRPSLWGDAVLALVVSSPACDDVVEFFEGEKGTDGYTAVCIAKRKGKADKIARFSVADAKKAKLYTKAGPWTDYPDRMQQMRARSWALRDQFADVLKGIPVAEEMMDLTPEKDMGAAEVVGREKYQVSPRQDAPAALENKAQAAPVEEQQASAQVQQPASTETLTPNMIKMVNTQLGKAGLNATQLCSHFQVGTVEELPRDKVNAALDWIKAKAVAQ